MKLQAAPGFHLPDLNQVAEGVTAADLDAWCRDRLAAFKVPRRWTFVDALPRSGGGKLRRRDLT